MNSTSNTAYIDGQNLHLGTKEDGWSVDLNKFRIYLKEKYSVAEAHYYLGFVQNENEELYKSIQKAGFILVFKEHHASFIGTKKGNVDTDIVFDVMKNLAENVLDGKIILVSGDGDYKKLVDYLILKDRFEKILFPNKKFASSLYKKLGNKFFVNLGRKDVRYRLMRNTEVKEKGA